MLEESITLTLANLRDVIKKGGKLYTEKSEEIHKYYKDLNSGGNLESGYLFSVYFFFLTSTLKARLVLTNLTLSKKMAWNLLTQYLLKFLRGKKLPLILYTSPSVIYVYAGGS
jgi:hypothetical protein